ncbi:hypothetical protein IQ260_00425 [Leptolyngbya cf. ectocarpi LEGE 11479]|uniref:Uncharacterized protein n=1 Tax=Leptolyngbya cf. ectocarpi LEGE 11479 TaxID=1828722 RepID=A0A928X088_LEPEC|nr:hypothetical protein [Leptolyngbya ectocarpi]MBE9065119.1 hypothetical protein [Leptolyngbya cf. ectocarpi LEGE 11479]
MTTSNPGPENSLTFLYYFGTTTLLTIVLASSVLHLSPMSVIPNQLGLVMGLVGGGLGLYFNRSVTLKQPIKGHKVFLNQISQPLAELGYAPIEDDSLPADLVIYARNSLRGLLSGKIYIRLEAKTAYITSRAVHIRGLKQTIDG